MSKVYRRTFISTVVWAFLIIGVSSWLSNWFKADSILDVSEETAPTQELPRFRGALSFDKVATFSGNTVQGINADEKGFYHDVSVGGRALRLGRLLEESRLWLPLQYEVLEPWIRTGRLTDRGNYAFQIPGICESFGFVYISVRWNDTKRPMLPPRIGFTLRLDTDGSEAHEIQFHPVLRAFYPVQPESIDTEFSCESHLLELAKTPGGDLVVFDQSGTWLRKSSSWVRFAPELEVLSLGLERLGADWLEIPLTERSRVLNARIWGR